MKRILLILTTAMVFFTISAYSADSLFRFSLLTCTPGNTSSTIYGHSAIRVQNLTTGTDEVYNYGTYNFNEPHFLWNFLRGRLNYTLAISDYDSFYRAYAFRGRGITEQEILLSEDQSVELYRFLTENYRPENRYYLYDFLSDNCATRIRDIFNDTQYSFDGNTLTDKTYRDELHRMNCLAKWMSYGIDLILGARCDREITSYEEMFLPDRLSEHLGSYHNINTSELLTKIPVEILEPAEAPDTILNKISGLASPVRIFTLLLLIYIVIFLKAHNKQKFINIFSTIFYTIMGVGGVIIGFMWFGTDHVWTKMNWNILWMNPLFLAVAFMNKGKARFYISAVLTLIAALAPFIMLLIPQYFSPANAILIVILFFILLSYQIINKHKYDHRFSKKF